ncbi:phospholipase A [Oryzisolibacter sp. LB2S]|uniref:phospholipase A n=1 Tax=Alicycliphilus soli TaxID=3228789 RepID=UPI003458A3D5
MRRALIPTLLGATMALPALAQEPAAHGDAGWRQCSALADGQARLACFDQWAGRQAWQAPAASAQDHPPSASPAAPVQLATQAAPPVPPEDEGEGCRGTAHTTMSRFWELESGTDCGTLRFRGYRPMSVSVVHGSSVNRQPRSSNPINNASSTVDYRRTEMRVQLSVRTKLAKGLLPHPDPEARDSLWFGYTQQSYWQLFSPGISRPFRTTDHEPEIVYVYPTTANLPWGWRWRYSGLGLVHQSNGQSLPLSRSWNRVYLMTGIEQGDRWRLSGRIWKRIPEGAADDDNPGISGYIGRAELSLAWNPNPDNTLSLTARHSLGSVARGSVRLEWLQTLGSSLLGKPSNLRLHTQLFSGYGDSLVDYNRRRTMFSVGVSLVDF